MSEIIKKVGYLKYSGELVSEGAFDMKKSAEALLGFDEMLRYFISKEEPLLSNINFEIPVNIKKGSWEISLVEGIAGVGAAAYLTSFATTAGKEGVLSTGPIKDIKKIFLSAFEGIKWVIAIRNHRKDKVRRFEHTKFRKDNTEIGICNSNGEYLFVPRKYYELYSQFPEKIFYKNTKLIEKDRVLEIGSIESDGKISNIKITENEKYYFYNDEDNNEIILPELIHGDSVTLEGEITRTTESTNTIGLKYNGHVLVCRPLNKSLAYFKDKIVSINESHFFSTVKITGIVDRLNTEGYYKERKPMILFLDIQNIEKQDERQSLF